MSDLQKDRTSSDMGLSVVERALGGKTVKEVVRYATDDDISKVITDVINIVQSSSFEIKSIREIVSISARLQGCSEKEAAAGIMSKNIVSLYSMMSTEKALYSKTIWEDVISEAIVNLTCVMLLLDSNEVL